MHRLEQVAESQLRSSKQLLVLARGDVLPLQFHIEVDADKVTRWSLEEGARRAEARVLHAQVQAGAQLRDGLRHHLAAHQALADELYAHWLTGLR